ncbi:rRNA maturation RNase YbeY [Patescibacteria group bacterium AH-259-L05]|nr:rRNA maturation RNase YbeY [Patescibacteria group bacterium AH-259-L05]
MEVEVNNVVHARVSTTFIITVVEKAYTIAKSKQRLDNLSVALVDTITIKMLNRKYRKQNRVTDVLSFNDPPEIVICWKQLVINAKTNKVRQKKELALLLTHGVLHIVGYDHKTQKERAVMQALTDKILQKLSLHWNF